MIEPTVLLCYAIGVALIVVSGVIIWREWF